MLNFISSLFKMPHRIHPTNSPKSMNTKSIVSYLSNGNILLQQAKYTTKQDIQNMKNDIFPYFSK